ncbi:diguanylate cyclase [uncultured Clostridium sp.]|uniref:diguanylate cyclase n=1 Tax=uncultured Clostridium sp. TaxID=59620 RepID=UPI00338F8546
MMNSNTKMTAQELEQMIAQMEKIFTVVRILDKDLLHKMDVRNGKLRSEDCKCYSFWEKGKNCENCVAQRALAMKGQCMKIEFIGLKMYQVIAKYLEVDGAPCVVEMISCLDDETLLDAEGREALVKKFAHYRRELYTDALTGSYNRRYFEDQLKEQRMDAGIAMIDLDDLKTHNDIYGHVAGDKVLVTVSAAIISCVRKTDRLVRYGGDEFLLVMPGISPEAFVEKLHRIQNVIRSMSVEGYPQLKLSVSIGGTLTNGEAVGKAMCRADEYMYQAKTSKNTIVTEKDGQRTPEEIVAAGRRNASRYRILIVDDSEMNRMILSEMLKGEFEILEAENGSVCLDMLSRYEMKISLILLDIVMPGMDGFGVLEYMNRNNLIKDIPVIMISGEDSGEVIKRAYEMGVSDYIKRPFDMEVVHRRVLNTIKLYAKQRRLVAMVMNQVFEKEKNSRMLISVLSEIVEFRNGESGTHVLNINTLTTMILEQLAKKTDKYHLSWSNRMLISTASSLHDIGKIGIDEKILNKPGRLTPEERKIMEKHTVIGADMLANLPMYEDEPLMKVAYQICRWHHERYDGKGYPDGLKGEEIPISAQVVALADVYDALTSERVYKKAYSHEEAVQMICNGECGTFNPLLLECLCEIQDHIKKELQKAAYRSEMSDPERKNKKFEHYDNSQKKFFGAVTQAIEEEYGTAGEELSRMKTEEEK